MPTPTPGSCLSFSYSGSGVCVAPVTRGLSLIGNALHARPGARDVGSAKKWGRLDSTQKLSTFVYYLLIELLHYLPMNAFSTFPFIPLSAI